MTYTPTTWTDGDTQANAARFNKLEQGVKEAHDLAESGTSGTVPIFGSQAEALAWEAANPGQAALWFDGAGAVEPDPDDIEVVPFGPTWTDNTTTGGGTWTTPTETGVTYSPASGTANPGQVVTVTATAQAGYYISGGSTWTHTFPDAAGATWPMHDDFDRDIPINTTSIGIADTGQPYTLAGGGDWRVESIPSGPYVGEGRLSTLTPALMQAAVVDTGQADVTVTVTSQGECGCVVRSDGATTDNCYTLLRNSHKNLRLGRYKNGAFTILHTATDVLSTTSNQEPATFSLRCQGSSLTIFVDGVEIHTVTDTEIPSGDFAGVGAYALGDIWDLTIERL